MLWNLGKIAAWLGGRELLVASLVGGSGMAVMAFVEAEEVLDWVAAMGAVSVVIVIAVATRTEVGFVIAMAVVSVGGLRSFVGWCFLMRINLSLVVGRECIAGITGGTVLGESAEVKLLGLFVRRAHGKESGCFDKR